MLCKTDPTNASSNEIHPTRTITHDHRILVALFRHKRLYMKMTDSDATIFENGMFITSDKDFFQRASAGTGG